jgi:hypothetical protein
LADIAKRVELGVERYGTKLQTHNGRDALQDAYEEALDQCMYLRQAIEERNDPENALHWEAKYLKLKAETYSLIEMIVEASRKQNPDVAAAWIIRPVEDACMIQFLYGVKAVCSSVDPVRWSVRMTEGQCLSKKTKTFIFEPSSSNRDEAFYEECRWNTLEEAIEFTSALIPKWKAEEEKAKKEVDKWASGAPATGSK